MTGLPYPTPTRLDLAAGITNGEVTGYPGWTPPRAWRRRNQLDEREVTAAVLELIRAGIACWSPADGTLPARTAEDRVLVVLTEAGRAWVARAKARTG